jgi:hypothetical protein
MLFVVEQSRGEFSGVTRMGGRVTRGKIRREKREKRWKRRTEAVEGLAAARRDSRAALTPLSATHKALRASQNEQDGSEDERLESQGMSDEKTGRFVSARGVCAGPH